MLARFFDAERGFSSQNGEYSHPTYGIALNARDREVLERIRDYLGAGKVYPLEPTLKPTRAA